MDSFWPITAREALVVVVEDDSAVRNSLKFSLETEGFKVRTFADGVALLKEAGNFDFGCLVIDQNMPGLNGLDVIAKLWARDIKSPAILISGQINPVLQERAQSAGIFFIEKPLLGNVLSENIRTALDKQHGVRRVSGH